jgi:hypothetical protein
MPSIQAVQVDYPTQIHMNSPKAKFAVQLFSLNLLASFALHIWAYSHEPLSKAIYDFVWDCLLQSLIVTAIGVPLIEALKGWRKEK